MRVVTPSERRSRTTAALGVCLLAVLAGCGGLGGVVGEDTPQRTPFSAPVQYPPGVNESGPVDTYDLLSSHADELENRSVTVRTSVVQRFVSDDGEGEGTLRYRSRTVARYGEQPRHWYLVREVSGSRVPVFGGERGRVRVWSNRTVSVRSVTVGGSTSYGGRPPTRAVDRTEFDRLFTLFATLEPRFVERQTAGAGGTFVLRAQRTAVTGEGPLRPTLAFQSLAGPRNVTLTVTVTNGGQVRSYDLTYLASVENRTVRVEESVRFESVGTTTVPRPSWVVTAVSEVCAGNGRAEWCGRRSAG